MKTKEGIFASHPKNVNEHQKVGEMRMYLGVFTIYP